MAQEPLNYHVCRQIHQGIIRNEWDTVSNLFAVHRIKATDDITWNRETPLYIAVGTGNSHNIVENLVSWIMDRGGGGVDALRTKCTGFGYTSLHVAAKKGNIKSAKLLVSKDPVMPQILDDDDGQTTALSLAASASNEEMVKYLMTVTRDETTTYPDGTTSPSPFRRISGASILKYIIVAGFYDVAVYLVKTYPELAYAVYKEGDGTRVTALKALAAQETAFQSGSGLGFMGCIIYSGLYVKISNYDVPNPPPIQDPPTHDIPNPPPIQDPPTHDIHIHIPPPIQDPPTYVWCAIMWFWCTIMRFCGAVGRCILHSLLVLPVYLCNIYHMKVKHKHAQVLLEEILLALSDRPHNETRIILADAIQTAARNGCYELIEKCVQEYPEQIWYKEPGVVRNFIKTAIEHRREKVFNLIYQFSSHKQQILAIEKGENALHTVGKLPAYDRLHTVSGSALQMQRELQWFKEVEKIIEPSQRGVKLRRANNQPKNQANNNQPNNQANNNQPNNQANNNQPNNNQANNNQPNNQAKNNQPNNQANVLIGMTGREVFTHEHKQLLKDAQQWTKDISSSSTVVAALLVTITFAAMFTVPGGYDDKGKSNFIEDKVLHLFVIADAIALFSSCASVVMFLSTLARSSQEDFLSVLPLRFTLGLLSLFISVVTTMIAFSATLVLLLRDRYRWIEPVSAVASIPVLLFIWLQRTLFCELIAPNLTSIFGKQSDVLLQ